MKILVLFTVLGFAEGNFKHWKANTNFENGDNWNVGRAPCKNDRIIFPSEAPPVFIQSNTSILEMVLPSNGELILGNFASISFSTGSSSDGDCEGKDVTFTRTQAKSWFDPDNWCQALDHEGDCQTVQPSVLDTEMVPCKYESVTFASKRSFLVNLGAKIDITISALWYGGQFESVTFASKRSFLVNLGAKIDITISALWYGGQSYTTGTFRNFADSFDGKKQFKRDAATPATIIYIKDKTCSDASGCACGNDQGPIMEKICAIKSKSCPSLKCSETIHPTGVCCDSCGAFLTMEYASNFKLSTLKNMVEDVVEDGYTNVKYVVSKTSRDQIQVVLQDGVNGIEAAAAARVIHDKLKKDVNGKNKYGVHSIELVTSKHFQTGTPAPQTSTKIGNGTIWGIVLAILLLMVLFGIALFCYLGPMRRRTSSFALKNAIKNFGRRGSDMGVELSTSVGFKESHVALGGFENPIYDTPVKHSNGMSGDNLHPSMMAPGYTPHMAPDTLGHRGYDNPMYGHGPLEAVHDSNGIPQSESKASSVNDEGGFSNPVYNIEQEIYNQDPSIKFNPVFSTEGLEDDSTI